MSTRVDAPLRDLVEVDVERRLVELHDVDAGGDQVGDLLADRARERERRVRERSPYASSTTVSTSVIGPGIVIFSSPSVSVRAKRTSSTWTERDAADFAGDGRAHGLVAVVADPALLALRRVDAREPLGEPVHEMLARLLAVGDGVDARAHAARRPRCGSRRAALRPSPRPRAATSGKMRSGSASQAGFGKLPAIVVRNGMRGTYVIRRCPCTRRRRDAARLKKRTIAMRLDKFLKVSRLAKRRAEAKDGIEAGRINKDGRALKPGYEVKAGDVLVIHYRTKFLTVRVLWSPSACCPRSSRPTCTRSSTSARTTRSTGCADARDRTLAALGRRQGRARARRAGRSGRARRAAHTGWRTTARSSSAASWSFARGVRAVARLGAHALRGTARGGAPVRRGHDARLYKATTFEIDLGPAPAAAPPRQTAAPRERRAELRAAFLCAGSVAAPQHGYHLEFVLGDAARAERIAALVARRRHRRADDDAQGPHRRLPQGARRDRDGPRRDRGVGRGPAPRRRARGQGDEEPHPSAGQHRGGERRPRRARRRGAARGDPVPGRRLRAAQPLAGAARGRPAAAGAPRRDAGRARAPLLPARRQSDDQRPPRRR